MAKSVLAKDRFVRTHHVGCAVIWLTSVIYQLQYVHQHPGLASSGPGTPELAAQPRWRSLLLLLLPRCSGALLLRAARRAQRSTVTNSRRRAFLRNPFDSYVGLGFAGSGSAVRGAASGAGQNERRRQMAEFDLYPCRGPILTATMRAALLLAAATVTAAAAAEATNIKPNLIFILAE